MDTQRAPPALGKYRKVTACLSRLHHAKGVLLPRNENIHRVVASDLKKNA
jgi:hypothetical protein